MTAPVHADCSRREETMSENSIAHDVEAADRAPRRYTKALVHPALLILAVIITFIGSTVTGSGVARAQTSAAGQPDDATVDAIVRKLESSGKLDAAVDRAIDRYVKRKEQTRQQEIAGQAKLARAVDAAQDHIRGSRTAEVSLIEYA
ncbi:MAG: hypothetical protein JSS46_00430, partial [Proteobacteria bacterium]|nr:hypothetical protein [Pseudomonadota bacterium]